MTQVTALPVNSVAPSDWWRRVSTTVNTALGLLTDLYRRPVISIAANYAVSAADYALVVDATTGPITITLPDATQGRELLVKRVDATANAVTVAGTIDGATSKVVAGQWTALRLIGGASGWYTV